MAGKTTVACGVVNDREVREAFSKVLWVSVGQEPDVRELLGSIMEQINEQKLQPDLPDKEALAELKKATKGLKLLLVLDDVVSLAALQRNKTFRESHTHKQSRSGTHR